uniref:Sine oculis binding protein n=1 Tax=Euperipatoides kanangrensis TaxID=488523 RepID=A0A447G0X3_9BILA|nr:sine oculis binding protein [Euperipatoides kanangrensis]
MDSEDSSKSDDNVVKIKREPEDDDIKDYAETTMNELLGWYGYGKVDSHDTKTLNLQRFASSGGDDSRGEGIKQTDDNLSSHSDGQGGGASQHTGSGSASTNDLLAAQHQQLVSALSMLPKKAQETANLPPGYVVCAWCQKVGIKLFTLKTPTGTKAFCSELCFTQCRRASFKKNKVCDWCKHIRHTVNYVDFQDGEQQLQFCSDKCLNQYRMNIFCRETQAHLQMHPHLDAGKVSGNPVTLVTPDLWLRDCKGHESVNGQKSEPVSSGEGEPDKTDLSPSTTSIKTPPTDKEALPCKLKERDKKHHHHHHHHHRTSLLKNRSKNMDTPNAQDDLRTVASSLQVSRSNPSSVSSTPQSVTSLPGHSVIGGHSPISPHVIANSPVHNNMPNHINSQVIMSPHSHVMPGANEIPRHPIFPPGMHPHQMGMFPYPSPDMIRFPPGINPHSLPPPHLIPPGMPFSSLPRHAPNHNMPGNFLPPPPTHIPPSVQSLMPPVTIMVPYPIFLPVPIPIPIPIPVPMKEEMYEKLRHNAEKRKKSEDNKNSAGDHSSHSESTKKGKQKDDTKMSENEGPPLLSGRRNSNPRRVDSVITRLVVSKLNNIDQKGIEIEVKKECDKDFLDDLVHEQSDKQSCVNSISVDSNSNFESWPLMDNSTNRDLNSKNMFLDGTRLNKNIYHLSSESEISCESITSSEGLTKLEAEANENEMISLRDDDVSLDSGDLEHSSDHSYSLKNAIQGSISLETVEPSEKRIIVRSPSEELPYAKRRCLRTRVKAK